MTDKWHKREEQGGARNEDVFVSNRWVSSQFLQIPERKMRIACAPSYGSVHFPPPSFLRPLRFISFRKLPILNSSRIGGFSSGTRIVGSKLKYSRSSRMSVNSQSDFAGGIDDSEGRFLETEGNLTNGSPGLRRVNGASSWEARVNRSVSMMICSQFILNFCYLSSIMSSGILVTFGL